ncbi:MAG: hypothetical protein KTR32_12925, partial [Granulosicoccus sp.]|nr:hypothetical protein [Granulosicoccus sp.]
SVSRLAYALDGRLQGVPRIDTFRQLDISAVTLNSVALEIWLGFIFIRFRTPETGARSVAEQMAPVTSDVMPYKPEQLEPLLPASVESKPFNWKTIHDVDNEGYHVPTGHPALHQLYGDHYVDTMKGGVMVSHAQLNSQPARNWSVRHYQSILPAFDHLPESYQKQWYYTQLFPNLVFGFYPDMTEVYMTLPVSPTETRMVSRTYALPDTRRETQAARYLNMRINTLTADEDDKFVSWLESAMRSSAWSPPVLSELESGVRHYHHLIQQQLPITTLANEPDNDKLKHVNAEMRQKLANSSS